MGIDGSSQFVPLAPARELVAAAMGAAARQHDVRLMLIKGPTLAVHGLRDPSESADVDILIAPDALAAFVQVLERRGWRRSATSTTAHVLPEHSVTFTHPRWPLELDLHHRFPGFLQEPQRVFDALWERRQAVVQAHQPVPMPDLHSSVLIAGLNYERDPQVNAGVLGALLERARQLLDPDQLEDLANLAEHTGCGDTLREFMVGLGAPVWGVGSSDPVALGAWNLYRSGGSVSAVAWLEELRRSAWRQRPAIVWHALMFTEYELRDRFPQAPAGRRGIWIARYWRLKKAVASLPRAVRIIRGQSRTR